MDKFFSKKNKKEQNDGNKNSWQGGRSSDMDSIKKQNSSSRVAGAGRDGGSSGGTKSGNAKNNNVFANAGAGINDFFNKSKELLDKSKPNKTANSRGGQCLGGEPAGRVIGSISLVQPGPLGMEVEKRKGSQTTTIIAGIVPNSQADKAGLKRGDIVYHPQSNGSQEVRYDEFLAAAKSGRRPLRFDVRRIESSILSDSAGRTAIDNAGGRVSADSLARKAAMIAAAEAREAKHKALQKPISKTGNRLEKKQPNTYNHTRAEDSDETRKAVAEVKLSEQNTSSELGYNPYEAKAMTGGQARTATVAMTQGTINVENGPSKMIGSGQITSPGQASKPSDPAEAKDPQPTPEFEKAFSTLVTSSSQAAVLKSISIMRKVITNAVTKGYEGKGDESSKFRRVRLFNPKIKAAISDMPGGLEVMMSTGFQLSENDEDGETYLVFPPGEKGPSWLGSALSMMESYENGSP